MGNQRVPQYAMQAKLASQLTIDICSVRLAWKQTVGDDVILKLKNMSFDQMT
jgi:outer membrane biogenesis lipoprotein LolB